MTEETFKQRVASVVEQMKELCEYCELRGDSIGKHACRLAISAITIICTTSNPPKRW